MRHNFLEGLKDNTEVIGPGTSQLLTKALDTAPGRSSKVNPPPPMAPPTSRLYGPNLREGDRYLLVACSRVTFLTPYKFFVLRLRLHLPFSPFWGWTSLTHTYRAPPRAEAKPTSAVRCQHSKLLLCHWSANSRQLKLPAALTRSR
ncbi:jg9914 [Pararge aegeria aegeria]|uniref:Jg9914 protein n=1 Tax=Pararge aegeria aegeria TaxID=348720 RepID=A0A8S4RE58_9NEOP|nr:jg9914 [Pararge aegeria aegeria]